MSFKVKTPIIFFNASVILAGIYSPKGGSAKILKYVKLGKIKGLISEIVFNEVIRNSSKIRKSKKDIEGYLKATLLKIVPPPSDFQVRKFEEVVTDIGDAHLIASAKSYSADFLVSLDKKHILILKNKIRKPKIVTPGELIEVNIEKINEDK